MTALLHRLLPWSLAGLAIALVVVACAGAADAPTGGAAPTPAAAAAPAAGAAPTPDHPPGTAAPADPPVGEKLVLSDAQWKERLSPEVYRILRHAETEPPFCGGYRAIEGNGPGIYHCAGCGAPLFSADAKFHSGTGWPSFFRALPGRVEEQADHSYGMDRTEIHCARCGGHLGHVFDDGPAPTGMRYCINAAALTFVPAPAAGTAPATAPGTPAAPAPAGSR